MYTIYIEGNTVPQFHWRNNNEKNLLPKMVIFPVTAKLMLKYYIITESIFVKLILKLLFLIIKIRKNVFVTPCYTLYL